MRYVLRADASLRIGSGHVMRSSAIAEELISRGEAVVFVGQISNLSWVKDRILAMGFSEIYENSNEMIPNCNSDLLIVDSYEIPIDESFIKPTNWFKIVSIADEKTPNYLCDLRIHPGLDASWVGDSKIPILAGPQYIPFRATLTQYLAKATPERDTIKIAVVAGGSDTFQLVFKIAKILENISAAFEVLLFSNSENEFHFDSRFQLIEIGSRLDELTQSVDLVLTTASTSSLEFLARGLCVGVVCAVDNQKQYYKALGQLGVAAQIGQRKSSNAWEFDVEEIYTLITSASYRAKLISKSVGLIDFLGSSRIADVVQKLSMN